MAKLVRFDWAMKYLLRNKANFDILEGFLSELLKMDIKVESILESESNKNHAQDKFNRVDLLVKTQNKERILVEVQCLSEWDYLSRLLYGVSKVVTEYIREGEAYSTICKVISVSIVFFNLGSGEDYLYKGSTVFRGIHCGDALQLGENEMAVYGAGKTPSDILPEYYIIRVNQFRESIKDKLDEWIYFLSLGQIKPDFDAKGIQSAAQKLNVLRLDEKQRRSYEDYQEQRHYEASMALPYDIGSEDGRKEGLEEGLKEGRKNEKVAIAKKMLLKGVPMEEISSLTELDINELKKIKVEQSS
jgi:predicted transposase/invertase (TIGR01784 family)